MSRKKSRKGIWMKLRSAEVLRALMRQKDFSMKRLSIYSECSKSFIGFLCNGTKTSCGKDLAERIAAALDVPVEVLFEERSLAPAKQLRPTG